MPNHVITDMRPVLLVGEPTEKSGYVYSFDVAKGALMAVTEVIEAQALFVYPYAVKSYWLPIHLSCTDAIGRVRRMYLGGGRHLWLFAEIDFFWERYAGPSWKFNLVGTGSVNGNVVSNDYRICHVKAYRSDDMLRQLFREKFKKRR